MMKKSCMLTYTTKLPAIPTLMRKTFKLPSWCWTSVSKLMKNIKKHSNYSLPCTSFRVICKGVSKPVTSCSKSIRKMIRLDHYWLKSYSSKISIQKPLNSSRRCYKTNLISTQSWLNWLISSEETINSQRQNSTYKMLKIRQATPTMPVYASVVASITNIPATQPRR